jgi:hypothetical protein
VRWQLVDALAAQDHLAFRSSEACDSIDDARLPCAVRPDESDHLAWGDFEGDIVDRQDAAVANGQVSDLEREAGADVDLGDIGCDRSGQSGSLLGAMQPSSRIVSE